MRGDIELMKKILYINSCVRSDSRTDKIARALLSKLGGKYDEVSLKDADLHTLDEEGINKRYELIEKEEFDNPLFSYARQFADADIIVISAPHWDFSFPAVLKMYIENIYILGIVSKYEADGTVKGLCRAEKLYFVTTSGGPTIEQFGYDYIKALATECFGIKDVSLIKAEMLDIDGVDAEKTVDDVITNL